MSSGNGEGGASGSPRKRTWRELEPLLHPERDAPEKPAAPSTNADEPAPAEPETADEHSETDEDLTPYERELRKLIRGFLPPHGGWPSSGNSDPNSGE